MRCIISRCRCVFALRCVAVSCAPVSAFLEDSTASTEAMRAGDQEALTKNLMKIGRDGACPLAGVCGAFCSCVVCGAVALTPSPPHCAHPPHRAPTKLQPKPPSKPPPAPTLPSPS